MPPTDPMGHLCLNKTGVGELSKAMGYFFSSRHVPYVFGLTRETRAILMPYGMKAKVEPHTAFERTAAITQQDVCPIICGGFFSPDRFSVPV